MLLCTVVSLPFLLIKLQHLLDCFLVIVLHFVEPILNKAQPVQFAPQLLCFLALS